MKQDVSRFFTGYNEPEGETSTMPKTKAWHSTKESHHHDNTKCNSGSEIPQHERIEGTGGKPLCKECEKLNREGK